PRAVPCRRSHRRRDAGADAGAGPRPHEEPRGLSAMFKIALKTTLAQKRRLVGTALSVIIGVAFLAGTFVFTDTIQRTFDNLFADVYANTDAYVRSNESIEVAFAGTQRSRIPDTIVAEVAAVPGVSVASGDVQGYGQIVGTNGKAVGQPNGAPTFAGSLSDPSISQWSMVEGRRPSG